MTSQADHFNQLGASALPGHLGLVITYISPQGCDLNWR